MWQGARSKRQVGYLLFGNAIPPVTCWFLLNKIQLYSTPPKPPCSVCIPVRNSHNFLILFCLWRRASSKQNLILQSYSSAISPHFILKWRGKQWPTQGSHSWSKLAPTTGTARGRYRGLVQLLWTAVPVILNLVFLSQKGFVSPLHYKATSVHHWIGNPPPEHLDTQFIQRNPCLEQYFSLWGFLTRWVDFHRKWNIFFQIHFHLCPCRGEGIQSNLAVMCILRPCSYKGPYTFWEKSTELEMDVVPLQIARTVQRASWVEIKFKAWLKKFQGDPSQKPSLLWKNQKRGAWKRTKRAKKGEEKKHFIDQYPCQRRIFPPVLSGTDSFGGDIFRIRYMNFWLP